MIEVIPGLPANVVAARCPHGISGEQFDRELKPALSAALASNRKINVLLQLDERDGDPASRSLWDEGKLSLADLRQFGRLALVSDLEWVKKVVSTYGFFAPCSMKRFAHDDLDAALAWVQK